MKMTIPEFNTVEEWQRWAREIETDLNSVNEILNEAADEADLCSRYETTLASLPSSNFKFEGRSRRYTVEVSGSFDLTVGAEDGDETLIAQRIMNWLESGAGDVAVRAGCLEAEAGRFEWTHLTVTDVRH